MRNQYRLKNFCRYFNELLKYFHISMIMHQTKIQFLSTYQMEFICNVAECLWHYFTQVSVFLVATIVVTHLLFNLWPSKKLNLTKDSIIIITGGCMGIGKQMALQFARNYHSNILILDRRDDLFDQVKRQLQAIGCTPIFKKCDLSSDQQITETLKYIQDAYKKIDLFVYNAGIVIPKRSSETTPTENLLVLKINYFTPIRMIHALEPQLEGGHLAVVSSMFSLASGGTNYSTYGASKGAIYHYISSLRQQYKKDKRNITVSISCPFAINTGMFHGFHMMLEYVVPILDEVYVGKRMVKQFVNKKEVCFIYQYAGWLLRIVEMMPSQFIDWTWIYFDNSNYSAIKDRHAAEVKELEKKSA